MDKCFDIQSAISCESLMSTIINNCKSHPNELLACNDSRLVQYPLILKNAKEAEAKREKAVDEQIKKGYSSNLKETAASLIIDKCITSYNTSSDTSCDGQLRSLQKDCQTASSPYTYCKDERFVGYLKKYGIVNSTVSP